MKCPKDLEILDDVKTLVRILATVNGQSESVVAKRLLDEHRQVGSSVRRAMDEQGLAYYQWSERLNDFYSSTDAFLFETLSWNRSSLKQEMRAWILQSIQRRYGRSIRILSFGDGLGFDSVAFAQAGHQVDFFEVSEKSKFFAKELFAISESNVRILDGATDLEEASYDGIVMLDVLEHVHEPERCVASVISSLRPDGYLYTHSPFWLLTPAVSTHLAENQKYSGDLRRLFTSCGLRPTNTRLFWNPIELQKSDRVSVLNRPFNASLKIWLGGYLLWWGRHWNTPHIAAVKYLFSSKHETWKELEEWDASQ